MDQPRSVLIVDDNERARDTLEALLAPEGYQLAFADSGPAALDIARALLPDLVLLDVMMPGMDGFTVCQQLRADRLLALVPVIMVTALDDPDTVVRGIEAGADDFVTKPFNRAELRARVRTVTRLNRYRLLLEEQSLVSAERTRFLWVVEHSDDGYLIIGQQDEMRFTNPRARHYLSLPADPQAPLNEPFLSIVARQYRCEPLDAWHNWPRTDGHSKLRYLVRSETAHAPPFWLQVDTLDLPETAMGHLVVRLRDVTEQITAQWSTWAFHALVSHKLRTPLVSMYGGVSLLAARAATLSRPEIINISGIILAGVGRLKDQIDDIFRYLDAPLGADGATGCLLADVPAIIARLGADMGIESLELVGDVGQTSTRLSIPAQALELILGELIENARKFHPQHTPLIEITISWPGSGLVGLSVSDNGIALSPQQLARAWTPYYQAEKVFTGQVGGMGLGLAIVARLIWSVGGACRINNRTNGPGVIVELEIPLAAATEV